jgi:predicted transposase YdaD
LLCQQTRPPCTLVTELVSRKFPDITEEEIERMLGLTQLEQTKPYQQGFEKGARKTLTDVALKLLQRGMTISEVSDCTGLSEVELHKLQTFDRSE